MAEVTIELIKQLRDRTGAGLMDCKGALLANDGDLDKATDWLREKGLAKAAKKADRIAAEGLANIYTEGNKAAAVAKEQAEIEAEKKEEAPAEEKKPAKKPAAKKPAAKKEAKPEEK